ncbi:MAG TPA: hypothetical protein ENH44_02745 [Actinobacteria bacterium]|nr:hypothetical protein [Actinomycetota bacterium]
MTILDWIFIAVVCLSAAPVTVLLAAALAVTFGDMDARAADIRGQDAPPRSIDTARGDRHGVSGRRPAPGRLCS